MLLRLVAVLRAVATRVERVAERPAAPLPPWADATRINAAWARAARRSLAACGTSAFVLATFGAAAAAFHAGPAGRMNARLARATATIPAAFDHPAAEAFHAIHVTTSARKPTAPTST
ncbi:MAG TPA: hypothetical protein VKC59_08740, partial [Candidatus Limnocylindrales bacterium]|nr:hypothetical protein [Candidatus Limnocylindrales bacterium]